jgi:dTDP-glucose pyrophosphorylase
MDENKSNWRDAVLAESVNIGRVVSCLDQTALRIVLIIDEAGALVGTVSDGDIRRGLLKGCTLNSAVDEVVHRNPLVVPMDMDRELVLRLMMVNKIQQIPIVTEDNKVAGMHLWDSLTSVPKRNNRVVIMAGGLGSRLRPHTLSCPKPMLLISGKPMLEHIIEKASIEGFTNFIISIGYLGYQIENYFGAGDRLGVSIEYLREEEPLGTAGSLSLLNHQPTQPLIIANGDVITEIRYGDLLEFHCRQKAVATMAVRMHEWQNPYGVVHINGVDVMGFEEKPTVRNYINAGVYVLEPRALSAMQYKTPCDMPTLLNSLRIDKGRVVAYAMHEPWLDVGRADDLKKARGSTISSIENQLNSASLHK